VFSVDFSDDSAAFSTSLQSSNEILILDSSSILIANLVQARVLLLQRDDLPHEELAVVLLALGLRLQAQVLVRQLRSNQAVAHGVMI
jgi:hypothetical protein